MQTELSFNKHFCQRHILETNFSEKISTKISTKFLLSFFLLIKLFVNEDKWIQILHKSCNEIMILPYLYLASNLQNDNIQFFSRLEMKANKNNCCVIY